MNAQAFMLDAYDDLEIEAGSIGWPKSFKTDLTLHDKVRLQGPDAPKLFGWVLREFGTMLLDPRMSKTDFEGYVAHVMSLDDEGHRYYWHDGRDLREVGSERMIALLRQHNKPTSVTAHGVY